MNGWGGDTQNKEGGPGGNDRGGLSEWLGGGGGGVVAGTQDEEGGLSPGL